MNKYDRIQICGHFRYAIIVITYSKANQKKGTIIGTKDLILCDLYIVCRLI